MLTFYPGGFRSPPPGRIGFLDPGYERVKTFFLDVDETIAKIQEQNKTEL